MEITSFSFPMYREFTVSVNGSQSGIQCIVAAAASFPTTEIIKDTKSYAAESLTFLPKLRAKLFNVLAFFQSEHSTVQSFIIDL